MYICIHIYVHVYIYICMYAFYIHIYTYAHIFVCYTYIYIYAHTHISGEPVMFWSVPCVVFKKNTLKKKHQRHGMRDSWGVTVSYINVSCHTWDRVISHMWVWYRAGECVSSLHMDESLLHYVTHVLVRVRCVSCGVEMHLRVCAETYWYGVATISRLLKMTGLFCKWAL